MIDKLKYKKIDWSKLPPLSECHADGGNRSITTINLATGDYEVILDGVVSSYKKDGTFIESHPIDE